MHYHFGFKNTEPLSTELALTDMGLVSNYAVSESSATKATLENKTAPFGAEERITFTCRDIPRVDTSLAVNYPSQAKGVIYGVQLEAIAVGGNDNTPDTQVTEPVVVNISIRHPKTDIWSDDPDGNVGLAQVALERAVSSLYYAVGNSLFSRLPDLMRSQEVPAMESSAE